MRVLMIIPAVFKDTINQIAKTQFDEIGGEYSFTTPLYNQSDSVLSHYWASTEMTEENYNKIVLLASNFPGCHINIYDFNIQANFPLEKLRELGLSEH